jgi:hypothetical protein
MPVDYSKIPPPPFGAEPNAYVWRDWYSKVQQSSQIASDDVDTIETRLTTAESDITTLENDVVDIDGRVTTLEGLVSPTGPQKFLPAVSYLRVGTSTTGYISIENDGTFDVSSDGVSWTQIPHANWYTPTTASIGNSYWVRYRELYVSDRTKLTQTGSALDTWLSLASDRAIEYAASIVGTDKEVALIQIEISSDSGGATIVGSGVAYLLFNGS